MTQAPLPVFPYAGRVPDAGTDTSRDAAAAIAPKLGDWQEKVLRALAVRPMSDEQIEDYLGCARTRTSRPRRRELELKGYVKDSGERIEGDSGHKQIVWQLTAAGCELLS